MGTEKQARELADSEADEALWAKCVAEYGPVIQRQFPMMVVPVAKLLQMEELQPHEDVKEHLVEWKPGMASVFFVSHTWLAYWAPDKDGVKITLLKSLLQSIVKGSMKDIRSHYMADAYFGGQTLKGKVLTADLASGYVWMDIMSIPQRDPVAQGKAISSIVSYVSDSAYFCVLAGAWRHENGSVRDVRGWHGRGWYADCHPNDCHPNRALPACRRALDFLTRARLRDVQVPHGDARQRPLAQAEAAHRRPDAIRHRAARAVGTH